MESILMAHSAAILSFQAAENKRGNNGQSPKRDERLMHAADHCGRTGLPLMRNKECGRQSRGRDTEADRHLLHGARNGTCRAALLIRCVGINQSIHYDAKLNW